MFECRYFIPSANYLVICIASSTDNPRLIKVSKVSPSINSVTITSLSVKETP